MAENENCRRPVQFGSLNWLAQDENTAAESKEGWGFLFRGQGDWFRLSWNFILRPWIDYCYMQIYAAWLVNLQPWKLLPVAVIDLFNVRCLQHTQLWKQRVMLSCFRSLFWEASDGVSAWDIHLNCCGYHIPLNYSTGLSFRCLCSFYSNASWQCQEYSGCFLQFGANNDVGFKRVFCTCPWYSMYIRMAYTDNYFLWKLPELVGF